MINRVKTLRCLFFLFFFKKLPVCHRNVGFFRLKLVFMLLTIRCFRTGIKKGANLWLRGI